MWFLAFSSCLYQVVSSCSGRFVLVLVFSLLTVLGEFQIVAMFGQQVDPLPWACDPQGRPSLLCVQEPLAALPVGTFEFIRACPGRAFNRLHLDPIDRSPSDGSGQAFCFFFVHLRPFLRVEEILLADSRGWALPLIRDAVRSP